MACFVSHGRWSGSRLLNPHHPIVEGLDLDEEEIDDAIIISLGLLPLPVAYLILIMVWYLGLVLLEASRLGSKS